MRAITITFGVALVALAAVLIAAAIGQQPRSVSFTPVELLDLATTDTSPAPVEPCRSVDKVLDDTRTEVSDATHEVFTGDEARNYVTLLNAAPPATAPPRPDTVIIFASASKPSLLVVGFVGGCKLYRVTLPHPLHKAIVRKIKQTI